MYFHLHLGIWGNQLCLEWESVSAWQLTCSATLACWVWSGRGANVPHELGIKFPHKMPKSAPDFTVFPRAHMQQTPTLITSQFGKLLEADAENMRRVRKSADRDTLSEEIGDWLCVLLLSKGRWRHKEQLEG